MSTLYYRLRIRNAANNADALVITSVRGGTNPYLADAPTGDGLEFDPLTGQARQGAFTGRIVDAITSGTSRVFTSQLEDSNYRQQLLDRVGYYEWSTDGTTWPSSGGGVLCAGYVTGIRLTSGIVWEVTVSDGLRAVDTAHAFAPQYGSSGHLENISTFLSRWPNRGCVFGGPVIGGFLTMQDYNGWYFVVNDQNSTESFLKFTSGYGPPSFNRTTNAKDVADAVNQATAGHYSPHGEVLASLTTVDDADFSRWPGLVIDITGHGYYAPSDGKTLANPVGGSYIRAHGFSDFFKLPKWGGIYIGGNAISLNTLVRVRAYTARPTDISPIYWAGHPVDLLTKLWDEQGFAYNSTAATTVKNGLGAGKRLSLRITSPQSLQSFLSDVICGPFGIGVRMNDSGQLEPFVARIFANSTPSTTITAADVQDPTKGSAPIAFELDEQTALRVMTFEQQQLVPTSENGSTATDGFAAQTTRVEYTSGDIGAIGNRSVSYRIPGMAHLDQTVHTTNRYIQAVAKEIFDRWGRGIIATEIALRRGGAGDSLKLGDECIVSLPQLPNHNVRLGDNGAIPGRRMQVVRITPAPAGNIIKLLDSGPNAQPVATVPTVTIAASSDDPRTVATVTVTNAATLNALPAGVRLQIATTTGAAPASTDYTDFLAYQPGQIPTTAIRTPVVTAGRTVYVRGRTEQPGSQPSNWSTGVSVALTALAAVTSLTATANGSDGSEETLAWTNGSNGVMVVLDVAVRLQSDPATNNDWRIRGMDGGSTQYTLLGLTPSTAYTATVQVRDMATGDTVTTTVNFTSGATTVTLPTPTTPTGFANTDGSYGIAVVAADVPGWVEVEVATETGVGTGAYGSYTVSTLRVESQASGWTIWTGYAPNDGLRRRVQARHVRDGATASSWTSYVTDTPWTNQPLSGATPLNRFTSLSQSVNYATDQVTMSWVWSGDSTATFNIYVEDSITSAPTSYDAPAGVNPLAAGTSQYVYTSVSDLVASGPSRANIGFYLEAILNNTIVATSTKDEVVYQRN